MKAICPYCGDEFDIKSGRQIYCDKKCRLQQGKYNRVSNMSPEEYAKRTGDHIDKVIQIVDEKRAWQSVIDIDLLMRQAKHVETQW